MTENISDEMSREEEGYKAPSILNTISYGSGGFWSMFAGSVFGTFVFYFYEAEVGLNVLFIMAAFIIYTIWNAINDPLLGHLTDKITKMTRKLGKRFPWIVIGIIPANFIFLLLFTPPDVNPAVNPWPMFFWLLITTCAYDTFVTLCFVNVDALFPDKFRTDSARRKGRGWGTPLSMLALPVAMIVPPFLFTYGQQETYVRMAIVAVLILVTVTIILLPGMWENKYLIDHYYLGEETRESFIQTLKTTIKQKSFMIYIVLFFGFQLVTGSLTGSVTYAARFVLRGTEMDIIWLFAAFLNGALISVPIWIFIAKKVQNNKKMAVLGGSLLVLGTFSTAFYVGLIDSLIYMAILGFTMGNFWVLMTIYFADVLDERIVITKTDQRGATVGVQIFFGRFAALFQAIIFATIHILTGFPEGVTSWEELLLQSPTPYLAAFGIRLHMSVIPAFVLMICTLVYWISYPLTQDKILLNKAKIKELGF